MNADKVTAESAFSAGSELWILPMAQNNLWQQIDFQSGFLLSQCLLHQKKEASLNLSSILKETEIIKVNYSSSKKSLLVGTENHFFNKWVLLVPTEDEVALKEIVEVCDSLKIHSLRFFSASESLIQKVLARPLTSLNRISFVE